MEWFKFCSYLNQDFLLVDRDQKCFTSLESNCLGTGIDTFLWCIIALKCHCNKFQSTQWCGFCWILSLRFSLADGVSVNTCCLHAWRWALLFQLGDWDGNSGQKFSWKYAFWGETWCSIKLKMTAILIILHKDEKCRSVMLLNWDSIKHLDRSVH